MLSTTNTCITEIGVISSPNVVEITKASHLDRLLPLPKIFVVLQKWVCWLIFRSNPIGASIFHVINLDFK